MKPDTSWSAESHTTLGPARFSRMNPFFGNNHSFISLLLGKNE